MQWSDTPSVGPRRMRTDDVNRLARVLFPRPAREEVKKVIAQTTNAQLQSPFFRLPAEIRNVIYGYYTAVDKGLFYHFASNTLRTESGQIPDHAFAYTCRSAYYETRDNSLRINRVTFTTVEDEDIRRSAALFNDMMLELDRHRSDVVHSYASHPACAETVKTELHLCTGKIPKGFYDNWFKPELRTAVCAHAWPNSAYGEARSVERDLIHGMMRALTRVWDYDTIRQANRKSRYRWGCQSHTFQHAWEEYEPWSIIGGQAIPDMEFTHREGSPTAPKGYNSYSAASAAINFVRSLPEASQNCLRNVTLVEDSRAAAFPECHARGLIPYCRKNKNLRIERRVDLWDCILGGGISSVDVTSEIGLWTVEALALPALGMPKGSFQFILEENLPISLRVQQPSKVFDILYRDLAWQRALDEAYKRGYLSTPSWIGRRRCKGYIYDDLALVVEMMVQNKPDSLIRCNLPMGPQWNVEDMLAAHEDWDIAKWQREWNTHDPFRWMVQSDTTTRYGKVRQRVDRLYPSHS